MSRPLLRSFVVGVALLAAGPRVARAQQAPPEEREPAQSFGQRVYVGGSVAAGFGDIDYVTLAPLVGFKVVPHLELGVQPYYRWVDDSRYSPSVSTNDYGLGVFARMPIVRGFFAETDYQYTNYQYVDAFGLKVRSTHNAFLAGGGYTIPAGEHVGIYTSALYEFTYDGNDPYRVYDSPLRVQVGVAVGF